MTQSDISLFEMNVFGFLLLWKINRQKMVFFYTKQQQTTENNKKNNSKKLQVQGKWSCCAACCTTSFIQFYYKWIGTETTTHCLIALEIYYYRRGIGNNYSSINFSINFYFAYTSWSPFSKQKERKQINLRAMNLCGGCFFFFFHMFSFRFSSFQN